MNHNAAAKTRHATPAPAAPTVSCQPDAHAIHSALDRVQAIIEFELDGTIISANDNFLNTVGYRLDEVRGRHHAMFCDPEYAASPAYKQFWARLAKGEFDRGDYRRLHKSGAPVWINASYNPVFDKEGRPCRVVKFATDISDQKRAYAEFEGKINAISKSQAVIEFSLDGVVLAANENFLATVGYELSEVVGKHHRMFCEPAYAATEAYREFWRKLGEGNYDTGEYKRVARGGRELWLNSSAIQYIAEETEKSAAACDSIARSTDGLNASAGGLQQTVSMFRV